MGHKDYENHALCAACGGACCRHMPGATHPSDWRDDLLSSLADALTSRRYAVDWREAERSDDAAVYFIRPVVSISPRYEPKPVIDGSWGGQCTFLTGVGCELPLIGRPLSCRAMEPREKMFGRGPEHCWAHASHRSILLAWKPHQSVIRVAARIALQRLGLPSWDREEL